MTFSHSCQLSSYQYFVICHRLTFPHFHLGWNKLFWCDRLAWSDRAQSYRIGFLLYSFIPYLEWNLSNFLNKQSFKHHQESQGKLHRVLKCSSWLYFYKSLPAYKSKECTDCPLLGCCLVWVLKSKSPIHPLLNKHYFLQIKLMLTRTIFKSNRTSATHLEESYFHH